MRDYKEISAKHLLIVEGIDEYYFFGKLVTDRLGFADIQIDPRGGKRKIVDMLPTLPKISGFDRVERVGIIRDADDNVKAAFTSIRNALARAHLPVPERMQIFTAETPSVGIFILPNCRDSGALENICLESIRRKPAYKCVSAFGDCVRLLPDPPRRMAKSLALAYLAAMPDECIRVGEGAQKGYWDFDSPAMKPLREFLRDFGQ